MTEGLVNQIIYQHSQVSLTSADDFQSEDQYNRPVKAQIKAEKNEREEAKLNYVREQLDSQKLKILEATTEKGASSWLNALPLKDHGFYLQVSAPNLRVAPKT